MFFEVCLDLHDVLGGIMTRQLGDDEQGEHEELGQDEDNQAERRELQAKEGSRTIQAQRGAPRTMLEGDEELALRLSPS